MAHVSIKPSSHPVRSDFPSTVGGDSCFPRGTFPSRLKLKHSPAYAPARTGYIPGSTSCRVTPSAGSVSGSASCRCPLPTESPFARARCYRPRLTLEARVGGSDPAFIAHTGSCARPSTSCRLWFPWSFRSLQVAASPCWKTALPDVISAILAWVLGSVPRRNQAVHQSVTSRSTSASP